MIGMGGFGDLSFDLEDENEKETWPPAGSATLVVEDEMEALFISATWTVKARVNGKVMWASKPRDQSHGSAFVDQWARFVIRKNYSRLRRLGVDAVAEYLKHGGKEDDLG